MMLYTGSESFRNFCYIKIILNFLIQRVLIFWDIMPRGLLKVNQYFGETYRPDLQKATCFHAGFLHSLLFDPEDGGDKFLGNMSLLSTDYTALSQNSS
jgi:hypothetical protein